MNASPSNGHRPGDARLLVVEDEPNILELLAASLRYAGFEVITASAGTEAVQAAQRHRPDLIVLDVMLPDMDGFDVVRRLRGGGTRIPVVFLTARDSTEDKIRGLTLGGDDYVTKPFSLEEVIARIRAVLRRTTGDGTEPPPRLKFADLELDEDSHEVWRDGQQIQLSPTEFKLLRYFMGNANRVLSKMQILDHVWDYDFRGDTGIVESYVSVLRRKIDKSEPHLLHTLRGVGYVLRLPSSLGGWVGVSVSDSTGTFWQSVRRLPRRIPLWAKLITAVLALVAVALVLISLIGIGVLRSNLLAQDDNQLAAAAFQIRGQLRTGGMNLGSPPSQQNGEAVIWDPDQGQQQVLVSPVSAGGLRGGGQSIPLPAIPSDAAALPHNAAQAVTVGAASGSGRWRVIGITASAQNADGSQTSGVVIVATDASVAYHTISTLTGIDLLLSLLGLAALATVGAAVVRVSLRPLTDIEQTAGAIAAGDLSRRVPELDPRTEVGRLGRSLNTMLAHIELAFRGRAASESAARRSEERMRQFVADASHELRTPLTAIRGFAEYYRQRGGPNGADGAANGSLSRDDLDRIMRRVEQESARMGVLVEDMLLLARMDQQRPLDHSPVDLLTLAADAVHDARVVAPERSINLTVGAGPAPLVLGDEVRLRQVIGNLMSNALVHTPPGSPIEVRIRSGTLTEARSVPAAPPAPAPSAPAPSAPAPAAHAALPAPASPPVPASPAGTDADRRPAVILEIADRGPGLSPEQAAHVFERFYRADPARTSGGTGLGLAIVATLVAAHGGTVWVESPPGGGAVFRIALPLAPEAIGHDPEPGLPDILESHPAGER